LPKHPEPRREDPAGERQLWRLNKLGYLTLREAPGGPPVERGEAYDLIAKAAEDGLWTPRAPKV